jgi:hypothetical protein
MKVNSDDEIHIFIINELEKYDHKILVILNVNEDGIISSHCCLHNDIASNNEHSWPINL